MESFLEKISAFNIQTNDINKSDERFFKKYINIFVLKKLVLLQKNYIELIYLIKTFSTSDIENNKDFEKIYHLKIEAIKSILDNITEEDLLNLEKDFNNIKNLLSDYDQFIINIIPDKNIRSFYIDSVVNMLNQEKNTLFLLIKSIRQFLKGEGLNYEQDKILLLDNVNKSINMEIEQFINTYNKGNIKKSKPLLEGFIITFPFINKIYEYIESSYLEIKEDEEYTKLVEIYNVMQAKIQKETQKESMINSIKNTFIRESFKCINTAGFIFATHVFENFDRTIKRIRAYSRNNIDVNKRFQPK